MPADIQNIKIGVNLIDDYLLTQEAPVANGLTRNLFTVVQNPASKDSASELLTIDGDGDPVHFYPDPASQSGWITAKLGVTPPANTGTCNRIVGFYHRGILNALCYYPLNSGSGSSAVWMQSATPETWTPAELSATAKNWLGYTYQTDQYVDADGNAYLYGITGNVSPHSFFVMTYVTIVESGQPTSYWQPIAEMFPTQFSPAISDPETAAFRMTQGPGSAGSVTLLWVDGNAISHQDGTITWTEQNGGKTASFALSGQSSKFNPDVGTLTADNLYGIPGDLGSGHLLIVDSASTLYLVSELYTASPAMTALSGSSGQPGSATAVGVGVDAGDIVTIFAIEPETNYLWYLQQTDPTELTFGSWVQLGGTLHALTCPAYMRATPELFSAGLGTDPQTGNSAPAVYHTGQNLSDAGDGTYVWASTKVSAPPAPSNTSPTRSATYSMEIQAFDSGQNPVPGGTVSVTADEPVTVVWNGFAYHIGPNTPLEVQLDASGQATVFYESVSLKPPAITFTAYDTSNTVTGSRWCRGDVVQFIQSLDGTPLPTLPDSVAPQMQNATGSELISNGLTGGDYSQSGPADTAAQAINATGQYMVQNDTDASDQGRIDVAGIKIRHWQIDFAHPDGPRFRVLTDNEAADYLAHLPKPGDAESLGSRGSVFGDVAHFFKHEFGQLEKFTATIESGVLNIVFNDLAPFVISTIKQAGAALETIFAKIRQLAEDVYTVIKDVIAWLKMLFDWDDILNTHTAIKYTVNQTLFTNLQGAVTGAKTDLSKWFKTLNAEIPPIFNDLESYFNQSTSFNDMANSAQETMPAPTASNGNVLAATNTQNTHQQHASKCNYVQSRSQPSFGNLGAVAFATLPKGPGDNDPLQTIIQAIQTNIADPTNANGKSIFTTDAQEFLNAVAETVTNPSEFFDFVVLSFLEAAKDVTLFVMSALEAVVLAILNAVEQAFEDLETLLNTGAEIPIVTWLWKNVITDNDPFSILDLFCLLFAVPMTILYKIIFGGANASAPFDSETLNDLTTNGLLWPNLSDDTEQRAGWSAPIGYTPPSSTVLEVLGIIAGLSYFLSGPIDSSTDECVIEDEEQKAFALSVSSLVFQALQNGATAPYPLFAKSMDDWTDAEMWAVINWGTFVLPMVCDTAFIVFSSNHAITRFADQYGPMVCTCFGLGQLGSGTAATVYQLKGSGYTNWDVSNNEVGSVVQCLRFIIYGKDENWLTPLIPLLLGADVFLAWGTMVTTCGAAANG